MRGLNAVRAAGLAFILAVASGAGTLFAAEAPVAPAPPAPPVAAGEKLVATRRLVIEAIPESSYIAVVAPNPAASFKRLKETALYKIFQEEEVQKLLRSIKGEQIVRARAQIAQVMAVIRQIGAGLETQGLKIDETFDGGMGLAVVDFDAARKMPLFLVVLDLGRGDVRAKELVTTMVAFYKAIAQLQNKAISVSEEAIADRSAYVIHLQEGVDLVVTFAENLLIAGIGRATVAKSLGALADGGAKSVAPTKIAECLRAGERDQGVGGGGASRPPEMSAVANIAEFYKRFAPALPEEERKGLELLGVKCLDRLGACVRFEGEAIYERACLTFSGEREGIFKNIRFKPLAEEAFKTPPERPILYMAAGFDLPGTWDALLAPGKEVGGIGVEEIRSMLNLAALKAGVDVEKELMASLGDEVSLRLAFPPEGGIIPELVGTAKVLDERRTNDILGKFMAKGVEGGAVVVSEFKGVKIYTSKPVEKFPVPLSFAVADGNLLVAGLPQTLWRSLSHPEGEAAPRGLAEDPQFKGAISKLSIRSRQALVYIDARRIFETAYGTALPVIIGSSAKRAEGVVDLLALPRTETIARHLFPVAIGVSSREDALIAEGYGPTSSVLALGTVLTLGTAAAREQQQRESMGALFDALGKYAADHDGRYPDALAQLVPKYIADPERLKTPLGYVPGLGTDTPAGQVLLYQKSPRGGQVWVLETGGRVRRMGLERLNQMLKLKEAPQDKGLEVF